MEERLVKQTDFQEIYITGIFLLFMANHVILLVFISQPQTEVAIAHGSEGLKSSKRDPTLHVYKLRAGSQTNSLTMDRHQSEQFVSKHHFALIIYVYKLRTS